LVLPILLLLLPLLKVDGIRNRTRFCCWWCSGIFHLVRRLATETPLLLLYSPLSRVLEKDSMELLFFSGSSDDDDDDDEDSGRLMESVVEGIVKEA